MTAEDRTIASLRAHAGATATTPPEIIPGGGPAHSIRVVKTDSGFDGLAGSWNELLERAEVTVFQTYEWQRTWWKYFGGGRPLKILLFELNEKLEGIVPLFMDGASLLGIPVARHLRFLGAGLSDYVSPIALRGRETAVARSLAGYLATHGQDWDVFDLDDLNERSPYLESLPASLELRGLPVYRYHGTVCPAIQLPGTMEELLHSLGSGTSYNLKRKSKRLESNFKSTFECVRHESDDIAGAIADFAAIHGDRWKSQGHPSAFDDEKHREFHVEVSKAFARRDWLRIFFLKVDGKRVAVNFSFNFRSVIYMYQSNAHGPDDIMKCSPGLLVRTAAIRDGIGEGMRVFDFMRGDEDYKYREWNAVDSKNWFLRSSSRTAGGRFRFFLFLWSELLSKALKRAQREWYDYRRFRISGKRSTSRWGYIGEKIRQLFGMYIEFLRRHFIWKKRTGGNQ